MANKAALITVNYNGLGFLPDYFQALSTQTYKNFDIYFVDGGSHDASLEYVRAHHPEVKVIDMQANKGFAIGNNEGFKLALQDPEVEYIVCLNNDTIVEPGWLEQLIKAVDSTNNVDMASSMAIFKDGVVQSIGLKFEKNLIGNDVGGLSLGYGTKPEDYSTPFEVFCPNGVSALYTRRLIETVGMFDEDFFMYFEDFDLGMRARNKGFKCIFTPESRLVHLHSSTAGGRASPMKAYLIKRNSFFVAIKNFQLIDLVLFPIRDLMWMLKSIIKKDPNSSTTILKSKVGMTEMIKIVLRAYLSILLNTPKFLRKRFLISKA